MQPTLLERSGNLGQISASACTLKGQITTSARASYSNASECMVRSPDQHLTNFVAVEKRKRERCSALLRLLSSSCSTAYPPRPQRIGSNCPPRCILCSRNSEP